MRCQELKKKFMTFFRVLTQPTPRKITKEELWTEIVTDCLPSSGGRASTLPRATPAQKPARRQPHSRSIAPSGCTFFFRVRSFTLDFKASKKKQLRSLCAPSPLYAPILATFLFSPCFFFEIRRLFSRRAPLDGRWKKAMAFWIGYACMGGSFVWKWVFSAHTERVLEKIKIMRRDVQICVH